jgi:phospholipid/cholesterol/gamma-HCH transport system substrate-binding protein
MDHRSAIGPRGFAAIEHQVLGVVFLVLLALFVWLAYSVFNKTFAAYDDVILRASKVGLQLPDRADVKIRGVQVGVVRDVKVVGDGVQLTLGLFPSAVHTIPANVTARILPKTLFGEKFVALQVPEDPSPRHIVAGAQITESRVAIEVEKVLSDFYPLLRTVQPAQLNYTLTAIAQALEGRGEQVGENLVVLDDYLRRVNPQIPLLVDDLKKLGSVSQTYRSVVPELATLLRNSVTTGHTFVAKEQKIQALFDDVAGFSSTTRDFLERNGDNIIRLGELGAAQLPMYARYAPEYPCLLRGLVDVAPREAQVFRGYVLHINLETLPRQPRGYNPGDSPVNGDKRGPVDLDRCRQVTAGTYNQTNLPPEALVPQIDDGVEYPLGKGRPAPAIDVTSGYSGTAAERAVVNAVAGPAMGLPADQVPDLASLLFAPLARGTEVSLR